MMCVQIYSHRAFTEELADGMYLVLITVNLPTTYCHAIQGCKSCSLLKIFDHEKDSFGF
jgi:hypothetical protein